MSHWLFALRSYRRRKSRQKGNTVRQEIALTTFRHLSAKRAFKPGAEGRILAKAAQLKGPMDMAEVNAAIMAIVRAELAE